MIQRFAEFAVGDILFAPFVGFLLAAFVLSLILRPLLALLRFDRLFSNPAVAQISVFACLLALLLLIA
jgi:hypothetical protein